MKISVYITSYNQRDLLKQAIDSVLAQSLKPYEIIIVDDYSNDGSQEMIKSYASTYPGLIKTLFHEKNRGVTQSRIDAINIATGDYITYVDGDDLYLSDKLKTESALIKKYNAELVFSNYYRFTEDPENIISIWTSNKNELPAFGNMYFDIVTRKFPKNSLFRCELVSLSKIRKVGIYDTNLSIYEDYEMKIRLSKNCNIAYTLKPLFYYRDNPKGLSKLDNARHAQAFEYIFEKHASEFQRLGMGKFDFIKGRFDHFIRCFKKMDKPNSGLKNKIKHKLISVIENL